MTYKTIKHGKIIKQSYWNSKSKLPVWKQQNDDERIGNNIPSWKLKNNGKGKVKDWTTGKTGKELESSGHSWKDVKWDEEEKEEEEK